MVPIPVEPNAHAFLDSILISLEQSQEEKLSVSFIDERNTDERTQSLIIYNIGP